MTDSRIYGRTNSEITRSVMQTVENKYGELTGSLGERIAELIMDHLLENERDDITYTSLERYANDLVRDLLTDEPEYIEAIEGRDDCDTYIWERLADAKGNTLIDRVNDLSTDYFSR